MPFGRRSCRRDHPRVCGEKFTRKSAINCGSGSPPRVRGKGGCCSVRSVRNGITPACAGKSFFTLFITFLVQDHPRVCGEKALHSRLYPVLRGPPPRVRGTGQATAHITRTTGITPACAGKRHICKRYAMRRRDHPRVCGEKGRKNRFIFSHPGSPPRVRGKGKNTNRMGRTTGITPACAGKSIHALLCVPAA